jgi:catechol 2,3-dioxygenase-like lactoylglutathione lyase family enzyme
MEEIYPMPFFPMLIVRDLDASSKWYQKVLGFKHIFSMPEPGGLVGLVHLRWVKYADLLLTKSMHGLDMQSPLGVGVSLNFQISDRFDGDIAGFAEQAKEEGAKVSGPIDQPWNVQEVTVLDPDGYKLVFTKPMNTSLGFDKLIEQVSKNTSTEK